MATAYMTGDTSPTNIKVLMDGTTHTSIICEESDYSVTYTYTDDADFKYDYEVNIVHKQKLEVQRGWNNPKKINLPIKLFRNNPQRIIRNALPRKIRQVDYVA